MSAGKASGKPRGKATLPTATVSANPFEQAAQAASLEPQPGKQAMKSSDRDSVRVAAGAIFSASVDMDTHYRPSEPNARRWDYGLGVQVGNTLAYWIEPHPASSTGEVQVMLEKLDWLKAKLGSASFDRLLALTEAAREASRSTPFRWVATAGAIAIRKGSREANRLAAKGLSFPARSIRLPS